MARALQGTPYSGLLDVPWIFRTKRKIFPIVNTISGRPKRLPEG